MRRTIVAMAVLLTGGMVGGCGHEADDVPTPKLVPNALIDNLYVQPPRDGLSNMSLDTVSFRLRGRCIEAVWNGSAFTPAFVSASQNIAVSRNELRLPYVVVPFGKDHSLLGPLVPTRIKARVAKSCPQYVVFVAGLASSKDLPRPASPPPAPTR